ncbi:MAG: hypothetical protein IJ873_07995 [Lachnospiraceae bacterium]|nr:hypothetical protein [Lachnospiraceae bacterium]
MPVSQINSEEKEKEQASENVYSETFVPRFRDADEDGLIGAKGYFNLFQDLTSAHMYCYGLGNDALPERTGCAWIFTKYKLHIFKKVNFNAPLKVETWVETVKSPLLVNHALHISAAKGEFDPAELGKENGTGFQNLSADFELVAEGRVETCPFHLKEQKLKRLSEIDFEKDISSPRVNELPRFSRILRKEDGMEYRYTHKVTYTDLDRSEHMNNVKYIDLFLNAFSAEFHREHCISDMELHFVNQCFEGEEIRVYSIPETVSTDGGNRADMETNSAIRLLALKENGSAAAACRLIF